jgi:PTH1 family peptidyl-tRNA hydrolase
MLKSRNVVLIVGLGNPGRRFEKTPHNIGFMIIDQLQSTIDDFSDWKNIKKLQSEISEGEIAGKKVILAKPQTFMNNSGRAIKKLVSSFKFQVSSLWVIHDDLDLPLGKIRISAGRSSAGHKGVESIIRELRTKDFVRFRVGIRPATSDKKQETKAENFVLQKFSKNEREILKQVIEKTLEAIEMAIKEGVERAMNGYNK